MQPNYANTENPKKFKEIFRKYKESKEIEEPKIIEALKEAYKTK